MAKPLPGVGLRPYLPADAPVLAEIFRTSIEELTGDDYSEAQQAAWAGAADDVAAFGKRLGAGLSLVATLQGSPVGFIVLKGQETIDLLYVLPAVAGQGIGTLLCDALEKLAMARGAGKLEVDASDTARDFFARRGFSAEQRNTVVVGEEWLGNTTMRKPLAGARKPVS